MSDSGVQLLHHGGILLLSKAGSSQLGGIFSFSFSVWCTFVPPRDFSTNLLETRTSLWSAQMIRM